MVKKATNKFILKGKTFYLPSGKTIHFYYPIKSAKEFDGDYRIELNVDDSKGLYDMWVVGINAKGERWWEFKRGKFGRKYWDSQHYLNGKIVPSSDWPKKANEMFDDKTKKPPVFFSSEEMETKKYASGKTLVIKKVNVTFKNKIERVAKAGRNFIVVLNSPNKTGQKMNAFCIDEKGRMQWQFKRPKDMKEKDSIADALYRGNNCVRLYSWNTWYFDVDVKTGVIKDYQFTVK